MANDATDASDTNRAIIEQFWQDLFRRDFDAVGAWFTPDGNYILVGNYLTQDFSILKVNGTEVTDTGKRFKVPGHPASARMSQ